MRAMKKAVERSERSKSRREVVKSREWIEKGNPFVERGIWAWRKAGGGAAGWRYGDMR